MDLNIRRNAPQYAFFSEREHREWDGWHTHHYMDAQGGTILRVTLIVPEVVDGKPASVERGGRIVPPAYDDYVFVGEIAEGKLKCIDEPYDVSPLGTGAFVLRRPKPRNLVDRRDRNSLRR